MSFRRAFVLLIVMAIPVILAVFPTEVVVGQNKAVQQKVRAAVQAEAEKMAVQVAAPVAAQAPGVDPNKNPGFTDSVTFPTDRKAKRSIGAAKDFIDEQAWGEAAHLLQSLLDTKEDTLVEVQRSDGIGWTSLKGEANRLIGSMPPKGREFYELQFGARAKARLAEAKSKSDPQILAEVALQRYRHTEAGFEATNLLGTYLLDRGRFNEAALCFERLLHHEKADKLSPITLFKAALALRRAGDKANAAEAWNRLAKAGRDGVSIGEQIVSLDRLQQELDKFTPGDQPASPYDWAMFKGDATRSAPGNGGPPFLEVKWTQSTLRLDQTRRWIEQALKRQEELQQPILPSFFPVAATVRTDKGLLPLLLYRSYWGIHALNLQKEGREEWNSVSNWSLDNIAGEPSKFMTLNQWLLTYLQSSPNFLFENSTVGTLTTDNSRVYIVDDLALPPHPNAQPLQQLQWGGQASFGSLQDAVYHSNLQAFELATGKILWELGGRGSDKGELSDSYFLGPPLPLGGKLYLLTEKNTELRLVCLDPSKEDRQPPTISWIQTLANVRDRMLMDVGRRIQAAHLSYAEGILVCPTNAGVVLGVDLLSHSLAWAYSYREESGASDAKNMMGRGGRVFQGAVMWNGQMMGQSITTDWKTSAPVIQDGKVVFTAPDGPSVHCLNLRDGKRLWKESRADDLYLGGVYNGKVVLVGRSTCRALSLADGKKMWTVETGLPSGQGVASDNIYYLPLRSAGQAREPEVCSIDIDKGIVVAHTKSRKKEVPGNLLFYEGDVVSQTATSVTAYPQLRVRLAQIDEALQKNPKDPTGLTNRGELKLDQGNLTGAVEDLRTALVNNPPADVLPRTRVKLYETFTELFQRDFPTASQKYLDEFRKMSEVPIPTKASAEERQKLEEEQQRRQANYLCLLAKGREKQGRLGDAFQAYLDFSALAGNRELVTVVDEPAVRARPDVWAQGRIAAMVARATPEQRKPLEGKIAQQWKTVQATKDIDALRHFVALYGSLFTVGKEARYYLAEQLIEANKENAFLEAELQLLQLRRQDDVEVAARAVEALARLNIRKGMLEDAAYYYQILGRDYAHIVIRDGKTGADFFNELATDKRLLPYLDEPPQPWAGARLKAKEVYGTFHMQPMFVFEPEGEVLPFFQRHRMVLNSGTLQIKLLDRFTNEERWNENLPRANQNMAYLYNNYNGGNNNTRNAYQLQGHLVVLNLGPMVYGFDPINRRKLWEKNFFGPGMTYQNVTVMADKDGGLQVYYPDGHFQKLGQIGPVESSYVCLHTREGLMALDPMRGNTLWTKTDVPLRTQVFGDNQHIYLVEVRPDGSASGGRALRAHDGVVVDIPDFAALYQRRLRILGRNLLLSENVPAGGLALRLYDVHTGKDLWKKTFTANAVVLHSEDPNLAGVVEPKNGGKVTVIDLSTFKEVLLTRVDPKDLDKVQEIHLLKDKQHFYLAFNKTPQVQGNPWGGGFWANVGNGMRWVMVNGKVYAFDRTTGKLRWRNDVLDQVLVLEQFQDLPILLFTAQHQKINQGRGQQIATVKSIDKRTGKLLWDKEHPNNYQPFYSLTANLQAGTIDFQSYNLKIQHYLDNGSQTKANDTRGSTPSGPTGGTAPRGELRAIKLAPAVQFAPVLPPPVVEKKK